jgi:hypothetical protein
VEAVSNQGGSVPALLRRLQERNRRREELRNEVRLLEGQVDRLTGLGDRARVRVADWARYVAQAKATANQVLKSCFPDRLGFEVPRERKRPLLSGDRNFTPIASSREP